MSNTQRIYNKRKIKKAKRVNIDKGETNLSGGGIPFTRKSHICMGRCLSCRDPKLETRSIRRRNKEDLRLRLAQESTAEPILATDPITDAPWSLVEIHPKILSLRSPPLQ